MIDHNWIFLGAAFNLVGSITYVIATVQGKTKPNRVTWFLWALAPLIAFAAMIREGVSPLDGLMTFMVGFGPLMVFIASFVNKDSFWKISTFDIVCGVLSVLGIVAWAVTRTGAVAILFSVIADALALLPTLVKSWKEPESENHVVFMNGAISALITLLALKTYNFDHLAFPIYIFVTCIVLTALIKFKLGYKYKKKHV